MSAPRPRLAVFAKAPVIGGPKRRLAGDLGDVAAWRIYRAMCARVLREAVDPRWETTLWVAPDAAVRRAFPGAWPQELKTRPQGAGDLGARIERVFAAPGSRAVIGTDAPDMRTSDIASAFKALARHDAVFGPARDGGFWLMGLARPLRPGALDGVRWSSPHALADTRAALGEGARVCLVRPLSDVDTGADWRARSRR